MSEGYRADDGVKDFQEHQNEIHSKLVAIMGDRISAHIKSLQVSHTPRIWDYELTKRQVVNWDVSKQGGDGVNDYMELLIKETVTLHKVLSRYLSAPIVEVCPLNSFVAAVIHENGFCSM